jgi:CPA2 family monovalent cation:H+ antiporter-2
MAHNVPLIATLAAAFGLALLLGFLATRIRLPPLVGYLLAGILIGPSTPGFVADVALSQQLAEVGVILLMFGVGLHFSLADLLSVKKIAVPGAVGQIIVATAMGYWLARVWGWDTPAGLVFGLALSVASTVVLLRALEDRGVLDSLNGSIAVGWLIVEDVAMVLVLVLLPALAPSEVNGVAGESQNLVVTLALTLMRVSVFVALMMIVGRRVLPWFMWQIAGAGSRELFTLAVISVGVGIAYAAALIFGVSFALGAFFAGMMLRESSLSRRAAEESLPLREAFSVLFFVSVGMLFEPAVVAEEPGKLAAVLGIVLVGKSLAAFSIVKVFGYPLNTALTVSASLAQIGEFSFILAALGVSLGVLPREGQSLILAGALISIALNPLVFHGIEPVQTWIRSRSEPARRAEAREDPLAVLPMEVQPEQLTGHVLLVGYGRVGRRIGQALHEHRVPFVVVEWNREEVERLRAQGLLAVSGDAADPAVLIQGHVARARILVIAVPETSHAHAMIDIARRLNPGIEIVARTHTDAEADLLRREKVNAVFMGEHELARGMIADIMSRTARLQLGLDFSAAGSR